MSNVAEISKTTGYKAVIPFYLYASLSFLAGCILLALNVPELEGHYFQPSILSIVHTMALGWGTMMILGAGHQLIPVIAESTLFSEYIALFTFFLSGVGIPMLVSGFYTFSFGIIPITGAILINLSVILYLVNLALTLSRSSQPNVQSVFMFTGALWLFITVFSGLLLLLNFRLDILPESSLHYLTWHAHMGIAGWFLLTITGASARLVPMFLLSEYTNSRMLWFVYTLTNSALIILTVKELFTIDIPYVIPILLVGLAMICYLYYLRQVIVQRIRKKIDKQMKLAIISITVSFLPVLILGCITASGIFNFTAVKMYGFIIFFGWITAIILAMTFKTLPFIVWNKHFGGQAIPEKQPSDLFNNSLFSRMSIGYTSGFLLCLAGIAGGGQLMLLGGSLILIIASLVYNFQTFQIIFSKHS